MKNKTNLFLKKITDVLLVILLIATLWYIYNTTTNIKSSIQEIIVREKSFYTDTINQSISISEITQDKNTFSWTLTSNISKDDIKGFRYLIELDNIPILSDFTCDPLIDFTPEYNGELTLSITPVCNDGAVGITSVTSTTINNPNLTLFSPEEDKLLSALFEENEFNDIFNDLLVTTGYISIYDASRLHTELKKIPIDVLHKLQKDKIKIHLTSYDLVNPDRKDDIYSKDSNYAIAGLFNPLTRTIHINNRPRFIEESVVHEIGHYIDATLGVLNYHSETSSKFKDIYNSEKDVIDFEHFKSSPCEFFAYSYSQYINNPDLLKEQQPKTFEHISNDLPSSKIESLFDEILDKIIF